MTEPLYTPKSPGNGPVFIAYTRVSTGEQKYGIGAQRQSIEAWSLSRDPVPTLKWVEEPARSGKDVINRPKLQAALEELKQSKAQGLIVAKLDRLSRSVRDFTTLVDIAEKEGWTIVCLDPPLDLTTPAGRMIANILASFAQFERELIAQRIREGLKEARRKGTKLGRKHKVPPEIARRIHREHEAGLSLRAIARGLDEDGIPVVRGGKQWYAGTVRGILESYSKETGKAQ